MGKLIFTILHILLVVVGVVLVTSFTDASARRNEILTYSHEKFDQGDRTFMIDGNYINETPIVNETVTSDGRTFDVSVYDVVYSVNTEEQTTFKDGIQLIIEQTDGDPMPYSTSIEFSGTNDFDLTIAGIQYYDLPLYVAYDQDNGKLRVNRDELGSDTITHITVTQNSTTFISLDVNISTADLTAMDQINAYMTTHDILNVNEINGVKQLEFLQIDTIPFVIRNLVIYGVIASILSAGVIFYRKRHMGRGKINPRLKEDLERIKNKDQNHINSES